MARVDVFQGGSVQRNDPSVTPLRSPDYGKEAVGAAVEKLGQIGSEAVDRRDRIEDINARVEANRLAIEHDELARQIGRRVNEAMGEDAEPAANQGIADLDKGTQDILGRASPRARALLEPEFAKNSGIAADNFLDHGFKEKVGAFESSSVARINRTVESAADEDDEGKALTMLADIKGLNEQRANFFGKGADWLQQEDAKYVSQFYKSRALKLTVGQSGSATAAIEYATAHRKELSDDDYNSIVSAYNDNSLDELATSLVDGSPLPSATTTTTEGDDGQPARKLDGASFFTSFIAPHEGSAYVVDSNGAGVKYGINAAYNPGVDVKGLTLPKAASVFVNNQWERSGAANLPPALAAIHADTFFLNEKQATRILKESGGDPDKYIALRRSFLNGLVAKDPAKYGKYQKGWEQRTSDLADFANRQGTDGHPLNIGADTDLSAARDAVMARTDIGMALKRKIIDRMEARRSDARQERSIIEEDAQRDLTTAMTSLGDKFTDVKQLPQDAWLRASPSTREAFTTAAKNNLENKPLSPDLARDIGFLRTFSPEKLADPGVQTQLAKRGVSAKMLSSLAAEGGQAQGAIAAAKASPVDRSTLEALARPAYEASGIFLWTTEASKGPKALQERQSDAYQQEQLLSFLRDAAVTWAVNNPGKKADDATMKGWIAQSLRMGARHQAIGTQNSSQVVLDMSAADREAIKSKLRSAGLPTTVENVATYYRRMLIQQGR